MSSKSFLILGNCLEDKRGNFSPRPQWHEGQRECHLLSRCWCTETLRAQRMQSLGDLVDSMYLTNSFVSFMKERSDFTRGWSQWSKQAEILSVGSSQSETMGRSWEQFLCIVLRKYISCVLTICGGRRYLAVGLYMCPSRYMALTAYTQTWYFWWFHLEHDWPL